MPSPRKPSSATRRTLMAAIAAGAAVGLVALGAASPASAGKVNEVGGLAIKGYDPVAYFTRGEPVPGSDRFTAEHNGATFRFASAEDRDLFRADPGRYAPQYGGFCAWATAHGYKADVDPAAFRLVSGKLYLNYSREVQAEWLKDVPGHIARGDRNWPEVAKLPDVAR